VDGSIVSGTPPAFDGGSEENHENRKSGQLTSGLISGTYVMNTSHWTISFGAILRTYT
jgi:hypothetical protein